MLRRSAWQARFPAFESADFRRLFWNSFFAWAASWTLILANGWLVFELSHSAAAVGGVTFAGMVPFALAGPIGGVVADRVDRRRLAIYAAAISIAVSLGLAALALSGVVQVWHVVLLAVVNGVARAGGSPAQDALLPNVLARREHLLNGVALIGISRFGSRLAGPLFGTLLLSSLGAGYVFVLSAGMVALSLWQLSLIEYRQPASAVPAAAGGVTETLRSAGRDLADGFRYVERDQRVLLTLVLVMLHCGLTMAFDSMMPTLATMVGGASQAFGAILVGIGVGAIAGTVALSMVTNAAVRGSVLAVTGVGSGLSMLVLGFAFTPAMAVAGAVLAGAAQGAYMALVAAFLQQIVPDALRGRVLSINMMLAAGHMGFMNFGFGWLADGVGVRLLLIGPGLLWTALFIASCFVMPEMRHLLRRGDFRPRVLAAERVPAEA